MSQIVVKVPDIGDFKEVEIIEVLVQVGDFVHVEQSLITVESDKASMEIPSSHAGIIQEIKVKIGDKVSQETILLILNATDEVLNQSKQTITSQISSVFVDINATVDIECDIVVLGAGPGGYSAAFRAADLGMSTVLIERYSNLGGVCLNVGCIPSKTLLNITTIIDEVAAISSMGIAFSKPSIDIVKLQLYKNRIITTIANNLARMAKVRKINIVHGVGQFVGPNNIEVVVGNGSKKLIKFKQAIIATGSSPINLPCLLNDQVSRDRRILNSTGALELRQIPKRMLIVGGGIVGLEMATVYSTLGARIDVVETTKGLMLNFDRHMVNAWQDFNAWRFDHVMLQTKVVRFESLKEGVRTTFVSFSKNGHVDFSRIYDLILVSIGRSPNSKELALDKAGVIVKESGFISVDHQMRTNIPHIFVVGDLAGPPMLAHKAIHEAHIAAEVAAGQKSYFNVNVIPTVAYTNPEIAWVGLTEEEAQAQKIKIKKGYFPWSASGRAISNGCTEGFTTLLFNSDTNRIIGGGIFGAHASDMISEIALAIEMGADAIDISKTIHPHPTLGESISMAASVIHNSCTDLLPTY